MLERECCGNVSLQKGKATDRKLSEFAFSLLLCLHHLFWVVPVLLNNIEGLAMDTNILICIASSNIHKLAKYLLLNSSHRG